MSQSSLSVEEYCESLRLLRKARDEKSITPAVDDLMTDELDRLWNELTVEECKEVERRFPELRVKRYA